MVVGRHGDHNYQAQLMDTTPVFGRKKDMSWFLEDAYVRDTLLSHLIIQVQRANMPYQNILTDQLVEEKAVSSLNPLLKDHTSRTTSEGRLWLLLRDQTAARSPAYREKPSSVSHACPKS